MTDSRRRTAALALLFTATILILAYFSYGFYTTLVISGGFVVGLVLWIFFPGKVSYQSIQKPYWLTMIVFLALHKTEEVVLKFQQELSKITGAPAPPPTSPTLIALGLLSIGGWLLIPYTVKTGREFGTYLAWSFFASMGITELAHFIFPLFEEGTYRFFPGMASVFVLAPVAWWGIYRMLKSRPRESIKI